MLSFSRRGSPNIWTSSSRALSSSFVHVVVVLFVVVDYFVIFIIFFVFIVDIIVLVVGVVVVLPSKQLHPERSIKRKTLERDTNPKT